MGNPVILWLVTALRCILAVVSGAQGCSLSLTSKSSCIASRDRCHLLGALFIVSMSRPELLHGHGGCLPSMQCLAEVQ